MFDFDGTLFDGDLGFEWLRWELLRSPLRLLLLVASLPLWAPLFLRRRWVQHGVAACFWLASLGRPRLDPARFLAARGAALRMRLFPQALAMLAECRAAGQPVVIATGALPSLVQGLLAHLPGGCPPVLGSELVPGRWGARLQLHLQGGRKRRALEQAGFGTRYALCVTDSLTDLALLRCSQRAVLVNFRGRRRRRTQARLAAQAPGLQLEWRVWACGDG